MTEARVPFEVRLREVLDRRYHHRHPFNVRMHEGALSAGEIRTWVRNRYYYQTRIPIKDGVILTKSETPEFRRKWIRRIHDHDGDRAGEGGLALWLGLAAAVGLDPDDVRSLRGVLPGVRAACDDYVRFVESHDLLESVASSLTELAAGEIMTVRLAAFEKHYGWVAQEGLHYFRTRTEIAPRDARHGLAFVLDHARNETDQTRCVAALETKCGILWRLLDAIEAAGRRPRLSPHAKLRQEADGPMVVLPERAVRLGGSGPSILEACDGEHTAEEVAAALRLCHPEAEHIESEVHEYLAEMESVGVLVSDLP